MADADLIRYIGVGRLSDGMICASVASKSRATELSEVVSRVISSGNFGAKSQLTVTINDSIGTLHLSSGEEEVFAVVAAADFSRRDCFNLLAEVAETFTTVSSADRLRSCDRAGELNKTCQGFMKELMTKYEAEVGTDKISLVNRQVDEVKSVMENNINKVMQNTENLSDVMNKTELMAAGASTFQKRSESIAKALWWRNFKMKLIIGLLVGAILGYIFIPIIIEAEKKDD